MTEQALTKLIGNPVIIDFKNPKPIGSTGYFLKSFTSKSSDSPDLKLNSKCNFEKRTRGILLRANYSNKMISIPIPNEEIIEITLERGVETIAPFFLSPMWIKLKFGVSIQKARYFRVRTHEYSIDEMRLGIKSTNYELELVANGYLFESQVVFFENLSFGKKLKSRV